MDTGKQSEAQEEVIQPDEVVVTESEATKANPQAEATEETELYVDDSSDDQQENHTNGMSQAQAYAAFQKKKKQSAQRKEELEASAVREQKLQSELNELKATVGKMVKGSPPTLEQFEFDEGQYQTAMKEYYSAPTTKTPAKEEANQSQESKPANDEAEFYLYQKEQELTKLLPDYEAAKAGVVKQLNDSGIENANLALNYLSDISRQKGVDVAKVVFAMNKSPGILARILKAGTNNFAVADILSEAESKVKTRSKKRIDSQPEPTLTNSGPIDNSSESVKKAKRKWMDDPSTANYNAYKAAQK